MKSIGGDISNLTFYIPGFCWFLLVSGFPETWKPETWKPVIMSFKILTMT